MSVWYWQWEIVDVALVGLALCFTVRWWLGYVKKNATAGRTFANWAAIKPHLAAWERETAIARVHGTTGEAPMVRHGEASRLKPIADRPPFRDYRICPQMALPRCGALPRICCRISPLAAVFQDSSRIWPLDTGNREGDTCAKP
jgi:hypothetical protein